jgi:hypothetical protein
VAKRKPTGSAQYRSFQALIQIAVIVTLPAICQLHAQEVGAEEGEIAAMSGATLGGLGGTHAVVAGSAGASFSRYIKGVVEAAVIPMNNQTLFPPGAILVKGSDLFDFNFALHGGVPIGKWEPYGIFGLGVLMNPYTAGFATPAGTVSFVGERHSKFGLEWGGGCRYYVGEKWGVRAEYRYTSSSQNFNRILGGVFYRIGVFGFLPALARRFKN